MKILLAQLIALLTSVALAPTLVHSAPYAPTALNGPCQKVAFKGTNQPTKSTNYSPNKGTNQPTKAASTANGSKTKGTMPNGQIPAGQIPEGQIPAGQTPAGQTPVSAKNQAHPIYQAYPAHHAFLSFFEGVFKGKKLKDFQSLVKDLFAQGKNDKQVLRYLVRHGYINHPLLAGLAHRFPSKSLKLLQDQPALLNGPEGHISFFMMVQLGFKKAVLLALEIRPELALIKTSEKNSILHYVTDPEITQALLDQGAPVNAHDKKGRTALYYAPNYEVARALVQHGADLVTRDYSNLTPIEYHKKFLEDENIITLLEVARKQTSVKHRTQESRPLTNMVQQTQPQPPTTRTPKAQSPKDLAQKEQANILATLQNQQARQKRNLLRNQQKKREQYQQILTAIREEKLVTEQTIEGIKYIVNYLNNDPSAIANVFNLALSSDPKWLESMAENLTPITGVTVKEHRAGFPNFIAHADGTKKTFAEFRAEVDRRIPLFNQKISQKSARLRDKLSQLEKREAQVLADLNALAD